MNSALTTTVTPAKAGASGHQAQHLTALGSSVQPPAVLRNRWNDEGH